MSTINKLIAKLVKKKLKISTAESCTGGLVAYSIIKNSGVSKNIYWLNNMLFQYAKIKYLSVSKKTLSKYGAVSRNVANEMIDGLYKNEKTQICVSTTGVAGPNGGTKYKPVGLVYVGIKIKKKKYIFKKIYKGTRLQIQNKTKNFIFKKIDQLI